MKFPAFAVMATVLAASLLAGCGLFNGTETHRYRITVEVDTPQGVRTGSSVWQASATEGSGIPDRGIRTRVKGEAVAVDLPGGTLFALLRSANMNVNYASGVVDSHFQAHPENGLGASRDWKERWRAIAKAKPTFELDPDEYPLLIRFRDINPPASVEKVDPAHLAARFGPGVRLRRITVSVTDDQVTKTIEKRLLWLADQKGMLIQVPSDTPMNQGPFGSRIIDGDFIRGFRQRELQ